MLDEKRYAKDIQHVEKGWGHEKIFVNNEKYCGKLLFFRKGKKCSFHVHHLKQETFFLYAGKLIVKYGYSDNINEAKEIVLEPGMKFEIPIGLHHQMIALEDSELFEFSTTDYPEDSIKIIKGD